MPSFPSRVPARAVAFSVVALLSGLGSRVAHAYRPFDGTDADVTETGEFELELGPLHYAQVGKQKFFFSPMVLNLGVMPRLELVADVVPLYPVHAGSAQLTDTDVLAKYVLRSGVLQGRSGPSIALEAGPSFPEWNAEKGFGASADLIASERWGWLALHWNNEGQLSRKDLTFDWASSLIAEFDLGLQVRPVTELGFGLQPSSGAKSYTALAGVIWAALAGLDLDAAARIGSIDGERAFEARLGFTWVVPVWSAAQGEAASR